MDQPPTFAFMDIDGTLLRNSSVDAILESPLVARWKIWRVKLYMLPRIPLRWFYLLGRARYEAGYIRALAALTHNWSREEVDDLFRWVARDYLAHDYREDMIALIRQHQAQGTQVILITNNFNRAAKQIALHVGADGAIGTRLDFRRGIATGRIKGKVNVASRYLMFIRAYLEKRGYPPDLSNCIAYADSAFDAPMLAAMGQAVAVYPDQLLRAAAKEQGWHIHDSPYDSPK